MELEIVKAGLEDIASLSIFSINTFTDTFKGTCTDEDLEYFLSTTYSPQILMEELENPLSEVWLLKLEEKITGFIKLNFSAPLPSPQSGSGMEIQRLYIDKEYHSLGMGKKLMELAETRARENHENRIWLGVWEYNEKAKNFYEKWGFQYFGSHPFPIGNTPQVDLWMFKNLVF